MTRFLKLLTLVMCTAAVAVVIVPVAQAQTGVLTTQAYPSIVTGQQLGGVTWDIGEAPIMQVTCASKLDATLFGPTDPVTFKATYSNCVADPVNTPVTVTMNACDYFIGFTKPGTTGQPPMTGTMQAWINCPAGQQIEIHVYENPVRHAENVSLCTYDIGPQGPVPAGIHHNTMMGLPDVNATINARFTARTTIGPGMAPCGGNPLTQHLPITLTGNYTLQAFQDLDNGVEGAQTFIDVG